MRWGRHGRENIQSATARFLDWTAIERSTGCWLWLGAKGSHGRYGSAGCFGKSWLAHRLAWRLFKGEDPGSACICHTCDNGLCVNPDHLFKGTQRDNILDMEKKNRSYHPARAEHGRAKLTERDVTEIRRRATIGEAHRAIARDFPQVSKTAVISVIKNRTWITR